MGARAEEFLVMDAILKIPALGVRWDKVTPRSMSELLYSGWLMHSGLQRLHPTLKKSPEAGEAGQEDSGRKRLTGTLRVDH